MAVPAHDETRSCFCQSIFIPIIPVVEPPQGHDVQEEAYSGDGRSINSGSFTGLSVQEFKRDTYWLEENNLGTGKVNFKLRDWLFSRQRYWGEPFPIVHTADGQSHALSEDELPISLPHIDAFKPQPMESLLWHVHKNGEKPHTKDSLHCARPTPCRNGRVRAGTIFDIWIPIMHKLHFHQKSVEYWQQVDLYIGGVEHAVLHLLYARFWHKVLYDCGLVPTKEPFQKLFNQGMILAYSYQDALGKYYHPSQVEERDGRFFCTGTDTEVFSQVEKMSKSKKNTVDPLDIIKDYGADTLRMYEMFMGPLDQVKPWQSSGCKGIRGFFAKSVEAFVDAQGASRAFGNEQKSIKKALHIAIQDANQGFAALKFNTPISKMMEFVNAAKNNTPDKQTSEDFIKILSPYAPHLCEEIWSLWGHEQTLAYESWPVFDACFGRGHHSDGCYDSRKTSRAP